MAETRTLRGNMSGVPSQVVNRLRLLLLAVVCCLCLVPTAHALRAPTPAESQLKEESAQPEPSAYYVVCVVDGKMRIGLFCGNNPIDLFDAMGLCPWWQDLWNALNNLADNLGDRIFGQDAAGYNPLYDPTNPNNLLNPLSPYYLNPNSFNDSPFLNGSTPPEPSIIPPNPAVDFTSGIYQPSEPSSLAIFGLGTSLVGGPVIAVLTAPAKAGTTVSLADGEASLVLMQDGQLVAQQPVASLMTHLDFAAQNGALTAEGGLAPGYWVGTVANVNGNIIALNSMTFYGNQMANADATIALRLVFH